MDKEFVGVIIWVIAIISWNFYQASKKQQAKKKAENAQAERPLSPQTSQLPKVKVNPQVEESNEELSPPVETASDQESSYVPPAPPEMPAQIDEDLAARPPVLPETAESLPLAEAIREQISPGMSPYSEQKPMATRGLPEVRQGIIWAEILGRPRSRSRWPGQRANSK